MRLVRRSQFGWPATRATRAYPRRGLVIHYDGSNQGLAGKPHSACVAYWKRTRDFHMTTRGWVDIGYSFACCPHSYVFEGRGYGRSQAAQPGGNTTWYSCTLMSGPAERPNAAQIDAVRELRHWLMGKGVAGAVRGHRDFVSTSCPGDIAYRMVEDGTFSKPPGTDVEEDDDMLGLKRGDSGQRVKGLQVLLVYAGYDLTVDGDYGPVTAATLLKMRKDQGSSAEDGDEVTPWAYGQLMKALAKRQGGEPGPAGPPGPQGPPGEVPSILSVSGDLSVNTTN